MRLIKPCALETRSVEPRFFKMRVTKLCKFEISFLEERGLEISTKKPRVFEVRSVFPNRGNKPLVPSVNLI
jgi:hypothetical protein